MKLLAALLVAAVVLIQVLRRSRDRINTTAATRSAANEARSFMGSLRNGRRVSSAANGYRSHPRARRATKAIPTNGGL